jgi:hypothetical protein
VGRGLRDPNIFTSIVFGGLEGAFLRIIKGDYSLVNGLCFFLFLVIDRCRLEQLAQP